MQAITDAELEAWHDYEIESPREIVALLRQLAEKNQLVRMLIKGEADVCVTSLLHVDPDTDTVIVEIDSMPMAKTHLFRIGDKTGARRRSENGRDVWEALSDRDFLAGRSPNVPPEPEKPAARAKPKRKAA